jgi:hypothetical protein
LIVSKVLTEMPVITSPATSAPELTGVPLANLATPFPDRFVGDDDAADEQEFLYITIAEAEPVVQPRPMADHFGREAVVLIALGG